VEETSLDLRDIIRTLKKRRQVILYTFLIAVVAAIIISYSIPPTYEAETTLRIKQPKSLANSLLADLPVGNTGNTKQLMSTYAEILKSRTVVQAVIDKTQSDKKKIPTYEDLLKVITTVPVKDTELLDIKVQARSAAEAELVANTLVDTFNERMTTLVRSEQTVIREFIGERLQESKKELEQSENVLQQYKTSEKIVAPADETKAMVDKLATVDKMAAENAVALASAQAKLHSANQQLGQEKDGFVADSPLIQQYKGKLADLEVQLVSLKQNYTDQYPQVLAVTAAITETKEKLNSEATRIVNAESPSMNPIHMGLLTGKIQSEAEIAAGTAQQEAIQKIIAAGGQELSTLPAKEQGLAKVMRDVAVNQEIYIMLAKRHEEARISEVMQPTDVQLIDSAISPEKPIKPNKTLNVIIAAILGLFIGTGLAFTLEYLNRTIRNADDVKHYLDLPVIGSIPDFNVNTSAPVPGIWGKITKFMGMKNQGRG
jgi:polysaccharide chain length determinant protein (PEP-CTERM system associated)